jgi:transcriptional regulator with XRE-family HTH domain
MEQEQLLMELGARVRNIRVLKGFSQKQLAMMCAFERSTMSKIESGNVNISYVALCRLCAGLNVKMSALVPARKDLQELG